MVLGSAGVAASQIVKQADVLMAHHLVPETMPEGSLEATSTTTCPHRPRQRAVPWDPRSVLARAGRLTEACATSRLRPTSTSAVSAVMAADGVQLGAMASVWHALVLGFAGVRATSPDQRALVLDPHIPPDWGSCASNSVGMAAGGVAVPERRRPRGVPDAAAVQLGGGPPVRVAPRAAGSSAKRPERLSRVGAQRREEAAMVDIGR